MPLAIPARTVTPILIHAPHRLDLDWPQLAVAARFCLETDETGARESLEAVWAPGGEGVAFLSVRSAFDACLTAYNWAAGDEILVSAITIHDMARLVTAHGLVAVPLDVDPQTLAPTPEALQRALTPQTRALLVADLFGGRIDLGPLAAQARAAGLVVLQDAAQAFQGLGDQGDPLADVRFFSFGTLKTATALGGAMAHVRDPDLRQRLRAVQATWPLQTRAHFLGKVRTAAAILAVQGPLAYTAFCALCRATRTPSGDVVRRLTRGFGQADTQALVTSLRRRPCPGQLRFLHYRLQHFGRDRLDRRTEWGERVFAGLPHAATPGRQQACRSHWLVPVSVPKPMELQETLLAAGFDASGASNVVALGGEQAVALVDGMVFLPAYPELPSSRLAGLIALVRSHLERHRPC